MKTQLLTLTHEEFIRRFLQHVLPKGFQKIRYYGLGIVFRIQNHRRFSAKYTGMDTDIRLMEMFGIDIHLCPCCGARAMRQHYRTFSAPAFMSG